MVWMGLGRSQVAFWRLFPYSAFKRKPIGKSTRGKQGIYRRPTGGGRE